MLFAMAATPKKFLHDWAASHKDSSGKFVHGKDAGLEKARYTCHIDDLVVECPFTGDGLSLSITAPAPYAITYTVHAAEFYWFFPLFSSLRGPPSLA